MGAGLYLYRMTTTFLARLPNLRLKPLPIAFGGVKFRSGIVSRVSGCTAFQHFVAIVRAIAGEQH